MRGITPGLVGIVPAAGMLRAAIISAGGCARAGQLRGPPSRAPALIHASSVRSSLSRSDVNGRGGMGRCVSWMRAVVRCATLTPGSVADAAWKSSTLVSFIGAVY